METLFNTYFLAHYSLNVPAVANIHQTTNEKYFEVEDSPVGELVIQLVRGTGVAKINNPNCALFEFVNYDKFLTALPELFNSGKKRCDMIFRCESKSIFALAELKDSMNAQNHRKHAKKQLLESLQLIEPVPEINQDFTKYTRRICCYFNKSNPSPVILNASVAFGRLNLLFQSGIRQSASKIEALGFEFYEFDGNQVLSI